LESTPAGVQLSVGNDAPLTVGKPVAGERQTQERAGDGLSGLAQRFEIVGGRLSWVHRADRFEVTATLPHGPPADSSAQGSTAGATG
jgi:signal transduction histidine kinase